MVIDTSALLAILFREPEEARLLTAITIAARSWVCPVNWTEAMIVAEGRKGEDAANRLLLIITHLEIGMTAIDTNTAWMAQDAWRRFGKGRHRAALNMGDCWAYAAARQRDEPLLFKGQDFTKTDILVAAW